MVLSGAPFIVPQNEHDVDLAVATVIPLIFLTTLLPDISDDRKRFQYVMRGLTIVAGFSALVTAFLQLAGEGTTAGTISVLSPVLIASVCAIFAMAWPIVVGMGKFAIRMYGISWLLTIVLTPLLLPVLLIIYGRGAKRISGYVLLALVAVYLSYAARRRFISKRAQRGKQLESQAEESSSGT